MSLSYTKEGDGVPVAKRRFKHRSRDQKVYLNPKKKDDNIQPDEVTDDLLESYYGKSALRRMRRREQLRHELAEELNQDNKQRLGRELVIEDKLSYYSPIPNLVNNLRNITYLCAKSGSGKTHEAKEMLEFYKDTLRIPASRKVVFTTTEKVEKNDFNRLARYGDINDYVVDLEREDYDEEYKQYLDKMKKYKELKIKFKYKRKLIDDPKLLAEMEMAIEESKPQTFKRKRVSSKVHNFAVSPLYLKAVKHPMVFIFDDYEAMPEKDAKKCWFLIDYIARCGRENQTHMIVITHESTIGHTSRVILRETDNFVVYRQSIPKDRIYLMKTYLGMDSLAIKRVERILNEDSDDPKDVLYGFANIDRNRRMVVCRKKVILY